MDSDLANYHSFWFFFFFCFALWSWLSVFLPGCPQLWSNVPLSPVLGNHQIIVWVFISLRLSLSFFFSCSISLFTWAPLWAFVTFFAFFYAGFFDWFEFFLDGDLPLTSFSTRVNFFIGQNVVIDHMLCDSRSEFVAIVIQIFGEYLRSKTSCFLILFLLFGLDLGLLQLFQLQLNIFESFQDFLSFQPIIIYLPSGNLRPTHFS